MAATAFEGLIAHVVDLLLGSLTAANDRVYRDLADALSIDDAPALVVTRGATSQDDPTPIGDAPTYRMEFTLACVTVGDTWATAADALHQAAHDALASDATLRQADIELLGTDSTVRAGDVTVGAITANYIVTVQPDADLT